MQPLLVHYCEICTYSTSVPFTASVFSQNNSCSHCGAVSTGVNVQPKKVEEANMQQEELARLFSASLNLSQAPRPPIQTPQPEEQIVVDQPVAAPVVYSSQHYTHSYHVVPIRHISQPVKTQIDISQLQEILLRHSIDPALLFPSQIDLFQNADDDQRLRLLELWRISPPEGRQGYPAGVDYNKSRQLYDWPPTSLAQEEAMAKLRYENNMEGRVQAEEIKRHQEQLDQSMDNGVESLAVQSTRAILSSSSPEHSAEPYILSGYDMLASREYDESAKSSLNHLRESSKYNQATDPAYNNVGGLWQKNVGSILDMENQYGAFAQARDHDVRPMYVDDEMVM